MSSATKKTIAKKVESVKKTFKDCAYLIDIAVMHGQAQGKDYNKIKKINIHTVKSPDIITEMTGLLVTLYSGMAITDFTILSLLLRFSMNAF